MGPTSWVPALLGLMLLSGSGCSPRTEPAASNEPPRTVERAILADLGVESLGYQRVESIAWRKEGDWWAVANTWRWDEPNTQAPLFAVLRSADAGRSWREDPALTAALNWFHPSMTFRIEHFAWLTLDIALIAGNLGKGVLRTEDAGHTWKYVQLPEVMWNHQVHDLEHVGGRTWACGSTGNIHRSDDAGATWRKLRTPLATEDHCVSLSFVDPERGWALGATGALFETDDGGEHWQPLKSSVAALANKPSRDAAPETFHQVVRLTPEVAWIAGEVSRFQTTDGGKTWQARPLTFEQRNEGPRVATTPSGQRIVTVGAARGTPDTWVPALNKDAIALGDDAVMAFERRDAARELGESGPRTYVSGRLVWAGALRGAGTGTFTALDGVAKRSAQSWLGWSGEHVFATLDAGRSWVKVGRFPKSPIQQLVYRKTGTALARAADGTLMRSHALFFGSRWDVTTDAMDAYDFAVGTGSVPAEGPVLAPFDCVRSTTPATLKVQFGQMSCFGGAQNTLTLELAQDGAKLTGVRSLGGMEQTAPIEPRNLSRAEGERIFGELAEIVLHEEQAMDCQSTNSFVVVMEWTCPSSPSKGGKLELRAYDCTLPPEFHNPFPAGYERAIHAHDVAMRILKNASH
ncbi:WD40/YVTN/BNR-like repeat-containing protein [Pyxidicoccus sp. MSG2]|uniref:WD40/YVTN/BNR-like repeat-containing protein n=1 Tax=Pyxidicoccus sp. MSG2 TaxID=2996790 RepID=UPI002271EDC3|nr:YCF48-related protein [Pyxidicoccus sp. MSG2]MCY1019796.1 YCF48-related protein [Pyxidicoccus sp. MSG2]